MLFFARGGGNKAIRSFPERRSWERKKVCVCVCVCVAGLWLEQMKIERGESRLVFGFSFTTWHRCCFPATRPHVTKTRGDWLLKRFTSRRIKIRLDSYISLFTTFTSHYSTLQDVGEFGTWMAFSRCHCKWASSKASVSKSCSHTTHL